MIDGGVQGYGPVNEWLFYRNVAEALQPDIVLIVPFAGNDATEAGDKEPWLDAGGPPSGQSTGAALNAARRVVRASMVLQLVRVRVDQLQARFSGPVTETPLTTYLADPPPAVAHGLAAMRRAYGMIAARAAAEGARTAIAIMPVRFQTDDGDYARLAAATREAGGELVRDAGTARFEAALRPLGLPMLDLLPTLKSQPNRIGLFFQRNVHLTPRGHEVVAAALFQFLETSGLLQPLQAGRPPAGPDLRRTALGASSTSAPGRH